MPSPTRDKTIISSKLKYNAKTGTYTSEEVLSMEAMNDPKIKDVVSYDKMGHKPATARGAMFVKDPKLLSAKELREVDEARGKRHYKELYAAKIAQDTKRDMNLLIARISKLEKRQEDFCEDLEDVHKMQDAIGS